MEEVPCRTPLTTLASPCFVFIFIGVETEGLLDYEGRAGSISIVRWNLRLVIFGVDFGGQKTIIINNFSRLSRERVCLLFLVE